MQSLAMGQMVGCGTAEPKDGRGQHEQFTSRTNTGTNDN
ncbi:hypothetical protein Z950_3718 [Sulfitobacter mediterraneus KCTC 32188]|nr:hypothetical protein Z950_3718 [Sulfitobacter mediterraneus KCTC 32188]